MRVFLVAAALLATATRGADLLLANVRVSGAPRAHAVVVRAGRVHRVLDAATDSPGPRGVRKVDARGGWVLPGFHDAHVHLERGGALLAGVDLVGADSVAEVPEAVLAAARVRPTGWIRGRGWGYDVAGPGARPHRRHLDAAVADRPVLLTAYDGHAAWANSAALEALGIDADTPEPEGGEIVRDHDGSPSGLLLESAAHLAWDRAPAPSRAERERRIAAAARHLVGLGITAAEDMSYALDAPELYAALRARGALPLRVQVWLPLGTPAREVAALRGRYRGPWLRVGGVKGFVDGVIESRTARLLEPYPGGDSLGTTTRPRAWLREHVLAAHEASVPVTLHCVGDGAVRLALDLFEEARGRDPRPELVHRIEHLEVVDPADLRRLRGLGVVASMQPVHAMPSGPHPERGVWARNLGPRRVERSFPWRSLRLAGAPLAFGSDWPVVGADPLRGLAVAQTRTNAAGEPSGGWNVHQALPASAALRAYTLGAAHAGGWEDRGWIGPGARADLVLLEPGVDPTVPATLWSGSRIRAVIIGGGVAFDQGSSLRDRSRPLRTAETTESVQ